MTVQRPVKFAIRGRTSRCAIGESTVDDWATADYRTDVKMGHTSLMKILKSCKPDDNPQKLLLRLRASHVLYRWTGGMRASAVGHDYSASSHRSLACTPVRETECLRLSQALSGVAMGRVAVLLLLVLSLAERWGAAADSAADGGAAEGVAALPLFERTTRNLLTGRQQPAPPCLLITFYVGHVASLLDLCH